MSAHTKLTSVVPAEQLDNGVVHLWWIPYTRDQGQAPLLAVIGRYLGKVTSDIILVKGEHGRPALNSTEDLSLDFNWSHSGTHAVIAVGRNVSLGVDVEVLRERANAMRLARRFFAEKEANALAQMAVGQRSLGFLQLWTAKEAVLKATGRGIAFGLHRLTIVEACGALELEHLDGDNASKWQLQRVSLHPDYVVTLAWRGAPREIHRRHF